MCDYVSKKVLNANLPSNRADTMHKSKYMFMKSPRNTILVSVEHCSISHGSADCYCEVYEHELCQKVGHLCRPCKEAHDQKLDNKHKKISSRSKSRRGWRSLNTSTETLL